MLLRPRDAWRHLISLPIVIGAIWVCTLLFPDDIKVSDLGSLIVAGSVYYILVALLLLLALLASAAIVRQMSLALAISTLFSLFAGVPILLIMNEIINGFWIGDAFVAFLISILCSMLVIGYEVAISRKH